jgi:hypothetical protein
MAANIPSICVFLPLGASYAWYFLALGVAFLLLLCIYSIIILRFMGDISISVGFGYYGMLMFA